MENDILFSELLKQYYELKIEASNRAKTTKWVYQSQVKLLGKEFANLKLSEITTSVYQKILNRLGKRMIRQSLAYYNGIVKNTVKMALADGYNFRDFTQYVELFSEKTSKNRSDKYLDSVEEILRLKKFLREHLDYQENPYYHFFYFCLILGTRIRETAGITLDNIDFENGLIHIEKSFDVKTQTIRPLKTAYSERYLPISSEDLEILKALTEITCHDDNKEKFIFFFKGFCSSKSHVRIIPSSTALNHHFRKCLKKVGIEKDYTLYSLRHDYISYLKNQGIKDDLIIKFTGHKDDTMIRKIYGGVLKEEYLEIAENVRNIWT